MAFSSKYRLNILSYDIFICSTIVLVGLVVAFFPMATDDYWFSDEYIMYSQAVNGESHFQASLNAIWEILKVHYLEDNSRLANSFVICCLWMPLWGWSIIKFISFVLFGHFIFKVSGTKKYETQKAVFTVFLTVFTIGWQFNFLAFTYFGNYVISSIFLLWTSYLFLNKRHNPFGGLILGIILGASHESFALAFIGGSIMACLSDRNLINKANCFAFAGNLIGLIWLVSAPSWSHSHSPYTAQLRMLGFLSQVWYLPAYYWGWLILLFFRRTRKVALAPLPLFALGTAPLIIVGLLGFKTRAAFPCHVMAICSTVWMTTQLLPVTFKHSKKLHVISFLLACLTLAHLAVVFSVTLRMKKSQEQFDQLCMQASKEGRTEYYPFIDVVQPWNSPRLALRRPQSHGYRFTRWQYGEHRLHFGMKRIVAIPTVLQSFSPEKATEVPSMPGYWFYDGHLVGPSGLNCHIIRLDVLYGTYTDYCEAYLAPFTADNGQKYTYFFVDRNLPGCYMGNPTDAIIHDWTEYEDISSIN